jgi:CAAX amino terminal protease family.
LRNLFGALFQVRLAWGWYLLVFGFWFAVAGIALGIGALFGQPFPAVGQFAWGSLPLVLIGMLLSNVWEEIGWRGFALPRLRKKYSDLTVVLLMGLAWSLWHLPLMLNPSSPMSALPWYGEILFSLSLTAIYTWLYLHTGGSLFLVTLFHAMANTIAFLLLDGGVFSSSYPFVVGVTTLFAVAVVLIYGPRRFKTAQD